MTSVTIPDSVTTIGENPFQYCQQLSSINVSPDHPTLATIDDVLFEKTTKTLVCYPSARTAWFYDIPQGIRIIGARAFENCDFLTSVSIPDSVMTIDALAFCGCDSLTSVSILEGVTTVGMSAFYGCTSLTSISLPESVTIIGDEAFSFCSSLNYVSIPGFVNSIGAYAFYGCSSEITFMVSRGSYTALWCRENRYDYTYPDANDWLQN